MLVRATFEVWGSKYTVSRRYILWEFNQKIEKIKFS